MHVRSLLRAFEQEGHRVREVALVRHHLPGNENRPSADQGQSRWSWITRAPRLVREIAEYAYTPVGRRRILREATAFRPDFLYERHAFANAAGMLAARRLGVPLVLEVNSPLSLELARTRGISFPRLARRFESLVLRAADRVCVVTRVLGGMLEELGVEPGRLIVTPNGVDLEQYSHGDRPQARLRALAALGVPELAANLVLGFVGFYRPWHRLDNAVRVLTRPELRSAHLLVIGEGPARPGLERLAGELKVSARLHLVGPCSHAEIPELLAAFDIALLPAINPYASPLKLHEYMAAGLPIVAPRQGNLEEVLEHGESALLVTAGDAQALAAAVVELATNEPLRRRLGARARALIVERDLTWRGNARRVIAALTPGSSELTPPAVREHPRSACRV